MTFSLTTASRYLFSGAKVEKTLCAQTIYLNILPFSLHIVDINQ
jgi:hypothetical protein